VWRSYLDFKRLHEALQREADKTLTADLPRSGW